MDAHNAQRATTAAPAEPGLVDADWARARLNIPKPTLYEWARRDPKRFGVERFGRKVMFRRDAIERLVRGEP